MDDRARNERHSGGKQCTEACGVQHPAQEDVSTAAGAALEEEVEREGVRWDVHTVHAPV